jgi:hypothetical protein
MAGSSIAACVGDEPTPPSTTPNQQSDASTNPDAPVNTNTLKAGGVPCGGAGECQSNHCSDGVCCDATCDGLCESCKLPGSVGRCTAIPDGQDPDTECAPAPLPDAGAPVDAGNNTDDGGDAGDAGTPVDNSDAGPAFNLPDGGYPATTESKCAGSCNGSRACKYPAAETSCGDSFCGNTTQSAHAQCDGTGHCAYSVSNCTAYSCTVGDKDCKTSCTKPDDCQDTFYCDGASSTCKPRSADGVSCSNAITCQSGYCLDGVCCNTACDSTGGGSCATPGHVGQCTCAACPGGTCQLFYQDADGDLYGDATATTANGRAKFACADAPPAGYVADHTDCFDSAAQKAIASQVHPGQGGWFTAPYTGPSGSSYDYDCSGGYEKQTTEGGSCFTCVYSITKFDEPAPPPPSYELQSNNIIFCGYFYHPSTCTAAGQQGYNSCYCGGTNTPFFATPVDCGSSDYTRNCGTCAGTTGSPYEGYSASKVAQGCH